MHATCSMHGLDDLMKIIKHIYERELAAMENIEFFKMRRNSNKSVK